MDISIYLRRTSRTTPTSFIATTEKQISRTLPVPHALELKLVTCAGEQASSISTTTVFQTCLWLPGTFTPKWNERCHNTPIKHRAPCLGTWARVYSRSSPKRLVRV